MSKKDEEMLDKDGASRRDFLKKSGIAVGSVAVGATLGGLVDWNSKEEDEGTQESGQHDHALEYFTNRADFELLAEATERIFPEDEHGPGAIGLGVAYYIDHQLAGKWGINAKEYRQGPFHEGTPAQGYQSQLKYHQLYDLGIEAIEKYSQDTFDSRFTALEPEQQDDVLVALEQGNVEMPGVSSGIFFEILRTSTLEGAYADPLYGGNKDLQGWKMKEYPGVQMFYSEDEIKSKDFIEIQPASLHNTHN